jgi:ribonuclease PH
MSRNDFRSPLQLRALSCEIGIVSEANGSSKFKVGNTEVLSTVYGPQQSRHSKFEHFDHAVLEIDYSLAGSGPSNSSLYLQPYEKEKAVRLIRQSLQTSIALRDFPRMIILVRINVLVDDGSTLTAAINSAIFALMDSGIPMVASPCSIAIIKHPEHRICIDPNMKEEKEADAIFLVNLAQGPDSIQSDSIAMYSIISTHFEGKFTLDIVHEVIEIARNSASFLDEVKKKIIQRRLTDYNI